MIRNSPLNAPATTTVRPERKSESHGFIDRFGRKVETWFDHLWKARLASAEKIVSVVACHAEAFSGLSSDKLRQEAGLVGIQLKKHGFSRDLSGRAFALVREAAFRTLGMRHYDCQLIGGWALLNGMVAEMETGEGKTLTATLAAATAALAGIPVHVISVNDYLSARDAETMGIVYRELGLSVGRIVHEVPVHARRKEYACDIVYATNKEIAFDYLRDRIVLGGNSHHLKLQTERLYNPCSRDSRLLMRGLHFAVVDEADSVFIDEARTPLIISGVTSSAEESRFFNDAMTLAGKLTIQQDFLVDSKQRQVVLTDPGRRRIQELAQGLGPLWAGTLRREETVRQALSAYHLFHADEHYLVQGGKVQIVDEFTGRVMADRSWERGLHQMVEIKEGCEVSGQRETLARISYQRFFRRYLKLAGMTGTAREISGELSDVYGLATLRIPTNRPVRRVIYPDRVFPTYAAKCEAVVQRVKELNDQGRPVLIGTRSVAVSEDISKALGRAGLEHQVLNAKREKEEAEIVAKAGAVGRITVATNMAGRGTDIKLATGVKQLQGLHVILTERHEASRIDRQLAGRCGRQGDPGSFEAILSAEDPLLRSGQTGAAFRVARHLPVGSGLWCKALVFAMRQAQRRMENLHARIRGDVLREDEKQKELLSFAGNVE